ncbi:hypothetical protein J6590_036964 [Homalodisca vitripennis]|nr:hypothetical protein J6590_036964 [Homalodisca vitripennis]
MVDCLRSCGYLIRTVEGRRGGYAVRAARLLSVSPRIWAWVSKVTSLNEEMLSLSTASYFITLRSSNDVSQCSAYAVLSMSCQARATTNSDHRSVGTVLPAHVRSALAQL